MRDVNEIKLHPDCIVCLVNKYLSSVPVELSDKDKSLYFQEVLKHISNAPLSTTPPEIVAEITRLQKRLLGKDDDYTEIKKHFNTLILSLEDSVKEKINNSSDSLKCAVGCALVGNYIDFGAMDSVDENKLHELLDGAEDISIDKTEFENLKKDLSKAKRLVYLTDNCGEVALDKLLVSEIKKQYPNVAVDVIVRGIPVLNDATLDDALQVGIDKVANVMGNGSDIAGNCIDKISDEAREKIDNADVIIAKGQGNFETMRYCDRNVYYLFMCKCTMFAKRFDVPRFSPMLINDLRMK